MVRDMLPVLSTVGLSAVTLYILLKWMLRRKVSVRNKVVLVTGASSGLGEACAHAFYKAGSKLILAARRKEELLRVKQDLMSLSVNTNTTEPQILVLDLSDLESLQKLVKEAIGFHGAVDILINNGGISYRGEAVTTSLDVDLKVMMVNYFGQMALTKALLSHMIQRKSGHIVGVSSIQGKIAIPQRTAYAASKHAFQAFFDSLRAELNHTGVKVSVISPAYIKTCLSVNAVTGSGEQYGVTDKTTSAGMSPEYAAGKVLNMVEHMEDEVILAPLHYKIIVCVRTLFPSIYFWIMSKRAKKQ